MRRWLLPLLLLLGLGLTARVSADQDGAADVVAGRATPAEPGGGFAHHVREALAVNRARKAIYAELSGGVSKKASSLLIQGETLTLPFAWWYDRKAKPFNAAGVGIVRDDFVELTDLPDPTTPPRYRRRATDAEKRRLKQTLAAYRDDLCGLLEAHDFAAAAARTREALGAVQTLERVHVAHWAMTVHILEQIGHSAERAQGYVAADPDAARLAHKFIRFVALGLRTAPALDHEAQRAHVLGVGVLVNDLPPIPFSAE